MSISTASNFQPPLDTYVPPTPVSELVREVGRGLWKEGRDVRHWVRKAERYKREGEMAETRRDLEEAFVYYTKSVVLMLDYIPRHPEVLNGGLKPCQVENLEAHGEALLPVVAGLKNELSRRYKEWRKAERRKEKEMEHQQDREREQRREEKGKQEEQREQAGTKKQSERYTSNGNHLGDASIHSGLDLGKAKGSPTGLKAIRLTSEALSRPSSPIPQDAAFEILFTGPPDRTSRPSPGENGIEHDGEDLPPTYEEIMGFVLGEEEDDEVSMGGDEYSIQVLEPDTSRAASPLPEMGVAALPRVDEKKGGKGTVASKGETVQGPSSKESEPGTEEDMRKVAEELDAISKKLGLFKTAGVPLPEEIRKKIFGLTQFLV